MAWRWPGDKPLSESMMGSLLTHVCVARPQWVDVIVPNCIKVSAGGLKMSIFYFYNTLPAREDEPTSNKRTNGFPTPQSHSSIFCVIIVTRCVCCVIWVMWVIVVWSRRRVSMVVVDGLVPIRHQGICNRHIGIGLSVCLKVMFVDAVIYDGVCVVVCVWSV